VQAESADKYENSSGHQRPLGAGRERGKLALLPSPGKAIKMSKAVVMCAKSTDLQIQQSSAGTAASPMCRLSRVYRRNDRPLARSGGKVSEQRRLSNATAELVAGESSLTLTPFLRRASLSRKFRADAPGCNCADYVVVRAQRCSVPPPAQTVVRASRERACARSGKAVLRSVFPTTAEDRCRGK